jgi:hypothetical protein
LALHKGSGGAKPKPEPNRLIVLPLDIDNECQRARFVNIW